MEIKERACAILGRRADIMTRDSIHRVLRSALSNPRCAYSHAAAVPDCSPDRHRRSQRTRPLPSPQRPRLKSFETDSLNQWVVERGIEIISEASRHLPADMKARHDAIPWRKVAGIGNVLRHNYEHVSASILWTLIREELPLLEEVCRAELDAALAGEQSKT